MEHNCKSEMYEDSLDQTINVGYDSDNKPYIHGTVYWEGYDIEVNFCPLCGENLGGRIPYTKNGIEVKP